MKKNRGLILFFAIAGLLPPLIFYAIDWYYGKPFAGWIDLIRWLFTSVITTLTISVAVLQVILWLQKRHPWGEGILKRLILEILFTCTTATVLIVILSMISHLIIPVEDLGSAIFNWIIAALVMNLVLVSITEGIFFFRNWKLSAIEAERFKRESTVARFESLKNQLNPHFLFNSLNTISSLIDHDKEMSKEFVDDLAIVYRYVLDHEKEDLVPIEKELEFIQSYCQLLKKRHGRGVSFHINLNGDILGKAIPPMALQLLIENAVKHNTTASNRPLSVTIFSEGNYLIVRNNLQKRKTVNPSGVGIKNLQARYQFLSDRNIIIEEKKDLFEIRIPLLSLQNIHK